MEVSVAFRCSAVEVKAAELLYPSTILFSTFSCLHLFSILVFVTILRLCAVGK